MPANRPMQAHKKASANTYLTDLFVLPDGDKINIAPINIAAALSPKTIWLIFFTLTTCPCNESERNYKKRTHKKNYAYKQRENRVDRL